MINRNYNINSFFPFLCALFSVIVICGNIFALKQTSFYGFVTPAGMICFPFSFSINDILTDVYGNKAAKTVIFYGFFNLLIFFLLLNLVIIFPSVDNHNNFEHVFELSGRIFLGTIAGYFFGEIINSKILSIFKYAFNGYYFIIRAIFSSSIGITIDTIIFNFVSFINLIPLKTLFSISVDQLILKFLFIIVGSFLASLVIPYIKLKEKIDVVDTYKFKKWIE